MTKNILSIVAVSLGMLLGGCKKEFLDINNDPDQATAASITPDLATAAQLNASASRNASTSELTTI